MDECLQCAEALIDIGTRSVSWKILVRDAWRGWGHPFTMDGREVQCWSTKSK